MVYACSRYVYKVFRGAGADFFFPLAQHHKRAMQRLTELNSAKKEKARARPSRQEAESECVVM
jgi:hypothetical protein